MVLKFISILKGLLGNVIKGLAVIGFQSKKITTLYSTLNLFHLLLCIFHISTATVDLNLKPKYLPNLLSQLHIVFGQFPHQSIHLFVILL